MDESRRRAAQVALNLITPGDRSDHDLARALGSHVGARRPWSSGRVPAAAPHRGEHPETTRGSSATCWPRVTP